MNSQRLQVINFFILLLLAAVLVLIVVWPFAKLIVFAAILAILFHPLYKQLNKEVKSPNLAAFISIIFICLMIVLPLSLLGRALFGELTDIYRQTQTQDLLNNHTAFWQSLPPQVQDAIISATQDTSAWLSKIGGDLFQSISYLLTHIVGFFLSMLLLLISTYYFLKDGKQIKEMAESTLPIPEAQENLLFKKIDQAISGVVRGTFLMALIRGIIVFLGFASFGIPNPVLWSLLFTVVSMIPPIGTGLGFTIAVVYLFLAGHTQAAIGMIALGAIVVIFLDTIFAPKIVSMQTHIHPLLILFGILGGIAAFGLLGLILGPILMALFAAMLEIYRMDLRQLLER